jgi:hypothetical protein
MATCLAPDTSHARRRYSGKLSRLLFASLPLVTGLRTHRFAAHAGAMDQACFAISACCNVDMGGVGQRGQHRKCICSSEDEIAGRPCLAILSWKKEMLPRFRGKRALLLIPWFVPGRAHGIKVHVTLANEVSSGFTVGGVLS